jgi:hypothetical protein
MSQESRQRRDQRWAARYEKSQAAFDARGRDSDRAGGWVERVAGPDGVSFRNEVIPPGEPVDGDYCFYARFVLSWFVRGWYPRASNEDWVVEVRPDRGRAAVTRLQFATFLEALEYVRLARLVVRASRSSLDGLTSS